MQYQWIHEAQANQQTWLFKRNCALTPTQLAVCFGALGCLSLSIATGFVVQGAWLVLVFAFIEVAALAAAFFVYARHAADYDRVIFSPNTVSVERAFAGRLDTTQLELSWLKVEYSGEKRSCVELVSGRQRVAVGRFVPESRLFELSKALKLSAASIKN